MTLALCLASLGYLLLGRHYFKAPWAKVPAIIVSRQEFAPLKVKLEHVSNLKPPLLWRMIRATSLYTLLMPLGPRNFRAPLTTIKGRPLAMLAFACLLAFWLALLRHWLPGIWRGDAFLLMLMAHWLATLLFFTWFNPHEPFLWLMYFLPLTTIAGAYCFASQGKAYWLLWTLTALLLLAHNAVYFYLRFL